MSEMDMDDACAMNPMFPIIDNSGSNGQEDVDFKRILRTERFPIDLPNSVDLPANHRTVSVVERIFVDNYENIYINWYVKLADGSCHVPFHFIGVHETEINKRREPGDHYGEDTYRVTQNVIDLFRKNASWQISHAQKKALDPTRIKRKAITSFSGEAENMIG